jgi:hypothetical protein
MENPQFRATPADSRFPDRNLARFYCNPRPNILDAPAKNKLPAAIRASCVWLNLNLSASKNFVQPRSMTTAWVKRDIEWKRKLIIDRTT